MLTDLFHIAIFPGFLFLVISGFIAETIDRKMYARLQNRMGPPWFQPVADFLKLIGKEELYPCEADVPVVRLMPIVALTCVVTAFLYIPLSGVKALYSFEGDIIVIIYLLTIPTISYFLGGWYSRSVYSMLGAVRAIIQLFAYEVPLFLAILAPTILANTWSLSRMAEFYSQHPLLCCFNIIGFMISIISLMGKLEKTPFDIPEAETEIVAGSFTEYSGRMLALFKVSINVETIVGAALVAAVFLPFGFNSGWIIGSVSFVLKILFIIFLMTLIRTIVARLRIDQMIDLCWRFFAPFALLQVLINLLAKEFLSI